MQILTGSRLGERFEELIKESITIDVAVAWATSWDGLDRLLSVSAGDSKRTVRMVVGVSGFITCPKALKKIYEMAELRIFEGHGRLFHSKMYCFTLTNRIICLVGSANLTRSAFHENIETVVEFEDPSKQCLAHFSSFWKSPSARHFEDFDLGRYEKERDERKPELERAYPDLFKEDSSRETGTIGSERALTSGWSIYRQALRARAEQLSECLRTLDAGWKLIERDWSADFSKEEKKVAFGGPPFDALGHLERLGGKNLCGDSAIARRNREEIGKVLRETRAMRQFSPDLIKRAFERLDSIEGCGSALVSRLLTLARPDWFVVVNKKSVDNIRKILEPGITATPKGDDYVRLISSIRKQPWAISPEPTDSSEQRLWRYRAALIDIFVYRGDSA